MMSRTTISLLALAVMAMLPGQALAARIVSLESRLRSCEYCYIIEVLRPGERSELGYRIVEVLRKRKDDLPRIELFGGKPKKGLYVVMATDNHPADPKWTEYQWHFYEVVPPLKDPTKCVVKRIKPDTREDWEKYLDLPMSEFRALLKKHPFRRGK